MKKKKNGGAKDIATQLKIGDMIQQLNRKQVFITLKGPRKRLCELSLIWVNQPCKN